MSYREVFLYSLSYECGMIDGMGATVDILLQGARVLGLAAPVWVPLILLGFAWRLWVDFVQLRTINGKHFVLLEITLPKEVHVSPLAFELLLNVLHDRGTSITWYTKWVEGKVIPWWSLEIVSLGGAVHFYVWVEREMRHLFESQFYAQFPDIEIEEAPDYTQQIEYDEEQHSMWGNEWEFIRPDIYPIKTYIDYELDKGLKEEEKVDPITALLEFMGSMQPGEQLWTQFVVRMHYDKQARKRGTLFGRTDPWVDETDAEVKKIQKEAATLDEDEEGTPRVTLTPGQRETIAALERSISKLPYDVGIRTIYIAEQDKFRKANVAGLVGAMRQYSTYDLNGFKPHYSTEFTHPWEDFRDVRTAHRKRVLFDAYRRRSFFYPPYRHRYLVLNTEELATVYHFPGTVATTPTLKRGESRKAVPPTDLPI